MQREAKITSKGQITVPREVRHALGVKPGDKIVFERDGEEVRVRPVREKSVFAKYRGIGNPGLPSGRKGIIKALKALRPMKTLLGAKDLVAHANVGKIAIVGVGMRSHSGVASKMFETLADEKINIQMIDTSTIKITCVIQGNRLNDAVRSLHDAFDLGRGDVEPERPFDPAGTSA